MAPCGRPPCASVGLAPIWADLSAPPKRSARRGWLTPWRRVAERRHQGVRLLRGPAGVRSAALLTSHLSRCVTSLKIGNSRPSYYISATNPTDYHASVKLVVNGRPFNRKLPPGATDTQLLVLPLDHRPQVQALYTFGDPTDIAGAPPASDAE
ncbi:hypothetical protein PTTG_27547 [Puccinia triticina 1-1 BBBD Race 1]|uniref:Uncharacterized protein n=1 Tax=Puccinia triticina (isolate 1-1 / race 1 (BBBD)) TaxID=630390 RepID=A0A180GJ61_PUCT1|nr:hypothetical protein PTTG_27547 [Puccinia triticina 1-1 BBBD Race 1]